MGRKANRKKAENRFDVVVTDSGIRWEKNEKRIRAEAALDGIYIVRISFPALQIGTEEAVYAYKSLSAVKRAFRSITVLSPDDCEHCSFAFSGTA